MSNPEHRQFWRNFLVGLLTVSFLVACGQNPQQKILGKWEELSQDRTVFEFFQDGTATLKTKQKTGRTEEASAKWLVLDDGRLKLDIVLLGTTVTSLFRLRFDGPGIILTDENGKEIGLKKLG